MAAHLPGRGPGSREFGPKEQPRPLPRQKGAATQGTRRRQHLFPKTSFLRVPFSIARGDVPQAARRSDCDSSGTVWDFHPASPAGGLRRPCRLIESKRTWLSFGYADYTTRRRFAQPLHVSFFSGHPAGLPCFPPRRSRFAEKVVNFREIRCFSTCFVIFSILYKIVNADII